MGTRRWWSLEHGSDGVAVATFRRPPRNLMSMAAMTELEALLTEVAEDDAIAVLVLTGGVPGFFVAHADVEGLSRLGAGQPVEGDPGSWSRAFALLESMPQPVVAAVGGQAWGGGSELCWACTARVASAAATFGQPEVLVLTGGVPGFFVAHADVEDLAKLGAGQPVEGDPGSWRRAFALLEAMPQPVVAAVGGQAWGGGSELCWACTTRVASASASFGQPEVLVGIIPGAGGTQRLPRLIGPGRAAELILSGRVVAADEALRLGMVEAVLPDDGFVDAAVEWAGRLAAPPRPAVVAAKRAIVDGLRLSLDDGLRREAELFLACQTRPDTLAIQGDVVRRYAEAPDDARITLQPEG